MLFRNPWLPRKSVVRRERKRESSPLLRIRSLAALLEIGINVSRLDGSLASSAPAEEVRDSSIYGSGVAVIRRRAKSGAERDGVEPMPGGR